MKNLVKILGCRGSVPVSGSGFSHYGGATSCVFVRLGGQALVLDAGTGLLALPSVLQPQEKEISLLLSHPHADHLMGLPMCPAALQPGYRFHVWAAPRLGLSAEDQVRTLMAPPLWPVGPEALPAEFSFHSISGTFSLGSIQVDCLEGCHPGGVTGFRLRGDGKTIVYLPDCTLEGAMLEKAAQFAQNCDLLICDGQYAPEEWHACSHLGHSTWEMAAGLGKLCGAKRTRIFHHAPHRQDAALNQAASSLKETFPDCTFAYEGEEIPL